MNNVEMKIDKLLEEISPVSLPGFIPLFQNAYAEKLLKDVKSKEDLNTFKKNYSGNSDYKTYDEYPAMAKRGLKYGALAGIPLAAIGAIDSYHGGEGFNTDEMETNSILAAGKTGLAMLGGAAIPAAGRSVHKALGIKGRRDYPSLSSRVSTLEKRYK